MADDSALFPVRPNSILADAPDFHSCRYSSWSRERRADPPRGSIKAKDADPWRKMEGELKRLDAANIKITEVDLLCMGDSDNVMYEFKLQEASQGLGFTNSSGEFPAGQHRQEQPSSTSSQGDSTQLAHAPGSAISRSRNPSQGSLHASPIGSPPVHSTVTNNSLMIRQPKTRVSHLVAASDAELEGYFSALESLQASPREDTFDDGVSWADVDADQLRSILYSSQMLESNLSSQSSSIRTADSASASPASSCFSSPAHTLSPAGVVSKANGRGSLLSRPRTGGIRSSRQLSPKTRTNTAPTEREGKGQGWPLFPPKSSSEKASPARAGSRLRGGSRLASACPLAAHSYGDLNQLARTNSEIANGSPESGGYVVAETAIDLDTLTSLHFSTPAQDKSRPAKSRLSRLHQPQPGGSGPLKPRTDMDFGSRSMRGSVSNSCGGVVRTEHQEETKNLEAMTPSRYEHSKRSSRHSRTLSWTGGDEVFDLFDLVNSEVGEGFDASLDEGSKHAQGPSDGVASRVEEDRANSREGTFNTHKADAGDKRASQLRSEKSLLGKLGRKLGWGKKSHQSSQTPAEVEKGEMKTGARATENVLSKVSETARACKVTDTEGDSPGASTNDESEVQRPSKYTMSRKKRQQLERMQFGLK